MPNPYVNKVQKSDGTAILDITDTTASAVDVMQGKYFYLATGERVSGQLSGGGGSVLVVDTSDVHGGTIREITAQSVVSLEGVLSVTPSATSQSFLPSTGYDGFASVQVGAIPSEYVVPTGTISISENGVYNVQAFASASISVSGMTPTGTISISQNGTYNVEAFASADVYVSGGGGGEDVAKKIVDRTISGEFIANDISIVGSYAFYWCSSLQCATFQNATFIGDFAFISCTALESINAPSVTIIKSSAFAYCSSLMEASFPLATEIHYGAFSNCKILSNITAPSATLVSMYAFAGCTSLTSVSFPLLSSIYEATFRTCKSLQTAYIPNALSIANYAFESCGMLTDINMSKVTHIGFSAFYSCSKLTTISIPSATLISASAFNSCIKLQFVDLPLVTFISSYGFYKNWVMSYAYCPSLVSTGNYAFGQCSSLTTAIFNNSASSSAQLNNSTFTNCRTLLSLYLLAESNLYTLQNVNVFSSTPISTYTASTGGVNGSVFVPEGIYNSYINATNWIVYADRIVSLTSSQVQHVIDYGTHVMD